MIEIDGARYSGSGTIIRQAVAYAALTGQPVHIVNARVRRPNPGLRPQHIRVVQAICDLTGGETEGIRTGSQEIIFRPGGVNPALHDYLWDVGSAGSATLLALAVLPILGLAGHPATAELRGGVFQDFAPSFYHVQQVMLPLLQRMGMKAELEMCRPGYVHRGGGILRLRTTPLREALRGLVLEQRGGVEHVWGIALASNLEERRVSHRMATAAAERFAEAGYRAEFDVRYETSALQRGAALAAFADFRGGARLGADRAGAPRRPAEAIGMHVAKSLLEELALGATLDRHAADQVIPFAALAEGESRFRIRGPTEHIEAGAWLAATFLGAQVEVDDGLLSIRGVGFRAST